MTGKPLDKIDTKPQLSARNAFQESEDGGNAVASLDEKALSIVQRQKRARIARKNKAKLAKARKIAQRKMANKEKLEKRSRRKARNIVRMRFSGRKVPYASLSKAEKVEVDKKVEKRQAIINKLAKKIGRAHV